jgi:hypothetical protein
MLCHGKYFRPIDQRPFGVLILCSSNSLEPLAHVAERRRLQTCEVHSGCGLSLERNENPHGLKEVQMLAER